MRNPNYISALLFGFGILLGLIGILVPIFVYKSTTTFYVSKIIDTRSFKFTKNIAWNERFENKSSDLYQEYEKQIINDIIKVLDGGGGSGRDKREADANVKSKNYEINKVQLLSLEKSIDNKVLVFVSVIYVAENEDEIPNAENESIKLTALKNVSNIIGADSSSIFCDSSQTTVSPATVTQTTSTNIHTSSMLSSFSASTTTTSMSLTTTIPITLSTTITPFIPIDPIANCSSDAKYVFQDLIFIYELNNDGNNKLKESEGIQKFISDILLNPKHFTFNKTKDGIQAMKLLILPYPNPMHFYSNLPSFNSINSINDLKTVFKQQLLSANSNSNQSSPETGVCFYLSNLNNQRRGLPTTLILFSKNVPLNFEALKTCLTELQKTDMNIILIGVGVWEQTEFASLCKGCYYRIDVNSNINNEEIIADQITQSLRAICSVNIP